VLKEMHLPTGIYWGSPAEPIASSQNASCCDIQPRAGLESKCPPKKALKDKRSLSTPVTVPDEQIR
jgi:hypothetical protein